MDDTVPNAPAGPSDEIPQPRGETPAIADFAEHIREESHDFTDWRVYENDVFAQVFEFEEHRRLQIWEERDFMGELDGYSWQEQIWSGSTWVDSSDISTEWQVRHIYERDLRERLDEFRAEAEATKPERLTPTEAALDRVARRALGSVAALEGRVSQLQSQLNQTDDELRTTKLENTKVTGALITLGRRIAGVREPHRTNPEQTGPATGSPTSAPTSLDR